MRDIRILPIAGRFWCLVVGPVQVPLPDGTFFAIFDSVEDAVEFRRQHS